jgi:hypothetical protein
MSNHAGALFKYRVRPPIFQLALLAHLIPLPAQCLRLWSDSVVGANVNQPSWPNQLKYLAKTTKLFGKFLDYASNSNG